MKLLWINSNHRNSSWSRDGSNYGLEIVNKNKSFPFFSKVHSSYRILSGGWLGLQKLWNKKRQPFLFSKTNPSLTKSIFRIVHSFRTNTSLHLLSLKKNESFDSKKRPLGTIYHFKSIPPPTDTHEHAQFFQSYSSLLDQGKSQDQNQKTQTSDHEKGTKSPMISWNLPTCLSFSFARPSHHHYQVNLQCLLSNYCVGPCARS